MVSIGKPADFTWQRSPEEYGFPPDAKAGDVINAQGDLLGFTCDHIVKAGMVLLTVEQAAKAQAFGWVADPAGPSGRNNGLVTVSR